VIPVKRVYVAAATLALLAAACLVVVLLRRHAGDDAVSSIDGSYLNRSSGWTSYAPLSGGDVLHPFHPLNAYLWLGATAAFALASMALLVMARLSSR
jgi:hypothetical protein